MPPGIVGTSFLFCVSARLLEPGSTSTTYGPGALPDRRSLGIASETTQTASTGGAPRVAPCFTRGWGQSDQFRPLPSRARLAGNDTLHANCRTKKHQFSATISETRFSHWRRPHGIYRSRGGGRGGWKVPTAAGSTTREAALQLFNSVRGSVSVSVSTIYRISFVCTQGRIETESVRLTRFLKHPRDAVCQAI
jgi:hypothetical protein